MLNDPTLNNPTGLEVGPNGELYVAERDGRISIAESATSRRTLANIPVDSAGERGLLNIALDADFANYRFMYVYYIGTDSRLHIGKMAVTGSGLGPLYDIYQGTELFTSYHNGGGLDSDLQGHIYFSVGENYQPALSQNTAYELGKVMRIRRDGSIPADNPYLLTPDARPEIYAIGLRNPFRLSVDQVTGQVYVGDVGSDLAEEVNQIFPGHNYGWPNQEGGRCADPCPYERPIYYYNRGDTGLSIILGPVMRSAAYPAKYQGQLLFGDWMVRLIDMVSTAPDHTLSNFTTGNGHPIDLDPGPDGRVYFIEHRSGQIKRIDYVGAGALNHDPIVQASCTPRNGHAPLEVLCSGIASDADGDALMFSWQLDNQPPLSGAQVGFSLERAGSHIAILRVSDGRSLVAAAPVQLQVGDAPRVNVVQPANGRTYAAGDRVEYAIEATAADGSALPSTAISVRVNLHHDEHEHDFMPPAIGATGSAVLPRYGETSPNIFYRLYATATQSSGTQTTVTRDIPLRKGSLMLATNVGAAPLQLDGADIAYGTAIAGVTGMLRTISAPGAFSDAAGRQFLFVSWSDGGAASHEISFPAGPTTLFANYNLNMRYDAPGNLFSNPALERSGGGFEPANWRISRWGTVNSSFTFAGVGRSASQGCSIVATDSAPYSASFCHPVEVPISSGVTYRYASWYRADVYAGVFALFMNDAGMYEFQQVGVAPASASWTNYSVQILPPSAAQRMTVFHSLSSDGSLTVDDVFLGRD